jgi:hypothetical protein
MDILTDASQYVNALSFVLTALLATRQKWADSPNNATTCQEAVTEGAAEAGTKTYNIKPAVMAGTFGAHFLADTYVNNTGFPHVVSMHSANLVAAVQMRNNFANSSVLRIIDATADVYNTTLSNNQVMGGSVLQGDSFKGRFEQVGFKGYTTIWLFLLPLLPYCRLSHCQLVYSKFVDIHINVPCRWQSPTTVQQQKMPPAATATAHLQPQRQAQATLTPEVQAGRS